MHGPTADPTFSGNFCKLLNTFDNFWGVLHMDQKGVADRFGGFFTWNKKAQPTILGGSSHGTKRRSRPFWGVLRMGQKADHFGGFFAWVKKPTVLGGLQIQIRLDISDTDAGISERAPAPLCLYTSIPLHASTSKRYTSPTIRYRYGIFPVNRYIIFKRYISIGIRSHRSQEVQVYLYPLPPV